MNVAILGGRLGADGELRHTQSGKSVLNLRLATTETWRDDQGQKQERTDWHSLVMWGKRAEAISQYMTKGKSILVRGRIETSSYEDKEGNKRYKTQINVEHVEFTGGRSDRDRDDDRDDRGRDDRNTGRRPNNNNTNTERRSGGNAGGGGGSSGGGRRPDDNPPDDFNPDDDIPFLRPDLFGDAPVRRRR